MISNIYILWGDEIILFTHQIHHQNDDEFL